MNAHTQENGRGDKSLMNAGRMSFFVAGFLLASWAPLVPYAKERAGIDGDSTLGFLLLCLGAGSIIAMSVAGTVASRLGCRRTIIGAAVGTASMLVCLGTVSSLTTLSLCLFAFGVFLGFLEVTANIHTVLVQNVVGRPIMSGFHSMYSVGGFVGAGGLSLLLSIGLSPLAATISAAATALLLLAIWGRRLLGEADREPAPFFVLPRGMVLVIGVLCFIMFLIEGAVLDWSAVFLSTFHRVEMSLSGLGYSIFAIAMTSFRLVGDRLVARNRKAVIVAGCATAAAGMVMVALSTNPVLGFAGFALVGMGAANVVPVLFSQAALLPDMPVQLSLASVSLLGYTGVLAGPALIGFVSGMVGLPATFMLLALLVLAPGVMATRILAADKAG